MLYTEVEGEKKMKLVTKPSNLDPKNSVDLLDIERKNPWGEPYCIALGILPSEVDTYSLWYRQYEEAKAVADEMIGE